MEHEVFIPVPAETLREALRDHARVARCVPGLQQDADASARPLSGRLKVRVGGHTITYRGALTLTERAGAFTAKGEGTEVRGTGSTKVSVRIRLTETDEGTTVAFTATSNPTSDGRLSDVPTSTGESTARRLLDRFVAALAKAGAAAASGGGEGADRAPGDGAGAGAGSVLDGDGAASDDAAAARAADSPAEAGALGQGTDVPASDGAPAVEPEAPRAGDRQDQDAASGEATGAARAAEPSAEADDHSAGTGAADGADRAASGESGSSGAAADPQASDLPPAAGADADKSSAGGGGDQSADADLDLPDDPDSAPDFDSAPDPDGFDVPLDASAGFGATASGEGDFLVPLDPPAEAAHARRTMIGRSAEEVDHAPPRGRYAPEQAPDAGGAGVALKWVAPAAALAIAGAVVVGRALRRRR